MIQSGIQLDFYGKRNSIKPSTNQSNQSRYFPFSPCHEIEQSPSPYVSMVSWRMNELAGGASVDRSKRRAAWERVRALGSIVGQSKRHGSCALDNAPQSRRWSDIPRN